MNIQPSFYAVAPAHVRYAKVHSEAKLVYIELTALLSSANSPILNGSWSELYQHFRENFKWEQPITEARLYDLQDLDLLSIHDLPDGKFKIKLH